VLRAAFRHLKSSLRRAVLRVAARRLSYRESMVHSRRKARISVTGDRSGTVLFLSPDEGGLHT
jgi:hypothetical protein